MNGFTMEIMEIIEIWHPINDVWAHVQQITKDGIREYYTNGQLITTREVNENGTIQKKGGSYG